MTRRYVVVVDFIQGPDHEDKTSDDFTPITDDGMDAIACGVLRGVDWGKCVSDQYKLIPDDTYVSVDVVSINSK